MSKTFTNAVDARDFTLAGNAILTLSSRKTGARYTFRVSQAKNCDTRWFVSLLTGPDNTRDYTYVGCFENGALRLTRASTYRDDATPVRAFRFFATSCLAGDTIPDQLEIRHEGRCGRCARTLTVPESIDRGIGPECAKHHHH